MKTIVVTPEVEARFWQRVDKSPGQGPNGDCWCWTGRIRQDGYPKGMMISGTMYRVSHVALAIIGKPRPSEEMGALHFCDNTRCVRPDHLRWGTELDNRIDAIARFKQRGRRSFSPEEVRSIRSSAERQVDLARHYGVTSSCICNIRRRVTHKHVS